MLKSVIVVATLALILLGPAHSAEPEGASSLLERCGAETDDAKRLACYDAIAKLYNALQPLRDALKGQKVPQAQAETEANAWSIDEKKDEIDDSPRVTIVKSEIREGAGFTQPAHLVARCVRGKTELLVAWGESLGFSLHEASRDVTLRIGEEKPETSAWSLSTDRQGSFYPGWPGNVLRRMAIAAKVALRVNRDSSAMTAVFDTSRLADALKPLAKACNWPPGSSSTVAR